MAYPGRDPLAFYRGLIDEVDAALGDLLARRAALTRVVQEHKRATHAGPADPGRDAAREREIVAAMSARAPELGEARLARIVHTIITESLEAAR
jgi:chorismate mutase